MGATVNLASRLCSRTEANTILVTKSFLRDIGDALKGVDIRHLATVDSIKGFEGETFELCLVVPKREQVGDGNSCQLCGGEMSESTDLGDYRVTKCERCGHTDLIMSPRPDGKRAA